MELEKLIELMKNVENCEYGEIFYFYGGRTRCQFNLYDKDGFPNCRNCTQWKIKKYIMDNNN